MAIRSAAATAALAIAALAAGTGDTAAAARRYLLGDAADVSVPTRPGFVLMGGGSDLDDAFRWMIERSGGGDFVVLRARGDDGYNPYIHGLGAVNSVETLILRNRRQAMDGAVAETIGNAEALFIAGGDQSRYVRFWKGTPVEEAIHRVAARGAPIGGTSAGLAVLGEFSFAALEDTVTSPQALADPYDRRVTLEREFLSFPGLAGFLTDSHFVERDRLGRSLVFLARLMQDGWSAAPREIAVDRATALLIDAGGTARLAGGPERAVYFIRPAAPPEACRPGVPLSFKDIAVYRIKGDATFDLGRWSGEGGTAYTLSVVEGRVTSTQPGGALY
jgi:cyanophycinase-like exopeptidase